MAAQQQEHGAGSRQPTAPALRLLSGPAEPMASTQDSWSNIPLELAGLVLKRLAAHVDRVRFTAVCPQWRSAARQVRVPPPPLPLLALKFGRVFYSMPRGEPLRFPGCKEGFSTACGNWLVYRRFCELLLVDPFSGATMTLPAASSVHLPSEDDGHDSTDESDDDFEHVKYFEVIKLMECSPNLFAALFQGSEGNQIAVCRPGGFKWSVAWDLSLSITDMAFYQGRLYVVDDDEELLALDISVDDKTGDPRISQIGQVINVNRFDNDRNLLRMLYLVESCGSLLLVRRRIFHEHIHGEGQIHTFAGQCEPDVSIFEADFGRSQWCKVTTLADNLALFLGPCSRSVWMPQSDSPGNRAWFLDDYKDFHAWNNEWPSSSLSSGTSSDANPKPFSPLPKISWRGYPANAGAAWLFPSN